jgi:D-alanine-D-alanine ligase
VRKSPFDVVVIYGGRSTEHEVSCKSAAFIVQNVRALGYKPYGIGIAKNGRWYVQEGGAFAGPTVGPLSVAEEIPLESLIRNPPLSTAKESRHPAVEIFSRIMGAKDQNPPNLVVFPMIHGTGGEDGTLQGLLEYGEIPYVGPDVLGSATGMDKVIAKKLVEAAGIKVVPSIALTKSHWGPEALKKVQDFGATYGWPLFVKPARLGSSVGVTKVKASGEALSACEKAFAYDDKILVEKAIRAREIEVGVLNIEQPGEKHGVYLGGEPKVSCPGEIVVHSDFYSFEAKYQNKAASQTQVPAHLSPEETREVQEMARVCYKALDLYGLSRVDFFLDQDTHEFLFNEVNTIPGFTEISLFPVMWKHSGLDSNQLIAALIESAWSRYELRSQLNRARD